MLATASHRAYPRYGVATVIILVLMVGLPALLIAVDPGPGDATTQAAEVIAHQSNITYTAPAGWHQEDSTDSIILKKGTVAIQLQLTPFTGTPAEMYATTRDNLAASATIVSMSEPSPTTINGIPAVEGQASLIVNGTDTSAYIVIGADGTNAIITEMDGPPTDMQKLKPEFLQLLSTVKIEGLEVPE